MKNIKGMDVIGKIANLATKRMGVYIKIYLF